jgi:NAD(P)-dependent dehydrogenase (short-subunit alcohol dehydrogenase family)
MAKTGGGSIINISSIMGFVGSASGHPAYHASKGAVRIYSKAAAVRYGPSGVRVNTVHPGYMPPMLNATNAGERADKDRDDAAAADRETDRGGLWGVVPGF